MKIWFKSELEVSITSKVSKISFINLLDSAIKYSLMLISSLRTPVLIIPLVKNLLSEGAFLPIASYTWMFLLLVKIGLMSKWLIFPIQLESQSWFNVSNNLVFFIVRTSKSIIFRILTNLMSKTNVTRRTPAEINSSLYSHKISLILLKYSFSSGNHQYW